MSKKDEFEKLDEELTEEELEMIANSDDEDDEEDNGIITLYDENKEPHDFSELGAVDIEDKTYVVLQPVELEDDMDESDVLIFELSYLDDSDEALLTPIEDEELAEKVLEELSNSEDCCCDEDDCAECGCGCHHDHE